MEVLNNILAQLKIIAEKNETIIIEPNITVEPPQVIVNPEITIEGRNEMAKSGNIILRERVEIFAPDGSQRNVRIDKPFYVALPNGSCNITLSTDCTNCEVSQAKIDNEFYMIKIKPNLREHYNHRYLAYNCR